MKPSKTGKPLPKSQLDFESFSLRPLRYISKYIFMANLRFVYCKSALKLGTVAVRILLENASFRQALKPVRTSKLTFSRVIWRHSAKHPLGFRVVLVTTTSIHLPIHFALQSGGQKLPKPLDSPIIITKFPLSVNWFSSASAGYEKFNSQMQQLFAYIFVHFIAPQQDRQHPFFCWQPIITPILLHRLYHITPFSTIYLYFALFIYPSCRNAQFPQALPKYDLA